MSGTDQAQGCSIRSWIWLVAAALVAVAAAAPVRAEDTQAGATPPPAAPAQGFPAQPPPAGNRPGFLHQLEVWWSDGFGNLDAKMKATKEKLDDLNREQKEATQEALQNAAKAAKDAGTAVVRLPSTRTFELHDRCQPAPNGAPDCVTAATNACHGKGFQAGQPLSVTTSQVCSPAALLAGRRPVPGDCHDETYILGVVCQ